VLGRPVVSAGCNAPSAHSSQVELICGPAVPGRSRRHRRKWRNMSSRKVLTVCVIIMLAISVPFVVIHLTAAPDDAPITPTQRLVGALANFFGPWGVAIVRLVDFPNAGLRSFSWVSAVGLTCFGGLLLCLALTVKGRALQIPLTVLWGLFLVVWFGVGLTQIADGLL